MARTALFSSEPYRIGEIVEMVHSGSLSLIVDIKPTGEGVGVIIRATNRRGEHTHHVGQGSSPVSPTKAGRRLPTYNGTLTDGEEALAMKYLLLGGPNNV